MNIESQLATLGPRLRSLRENHDLKLSDVAARTNINVSTLSRLESGKRKATLELLLPLTALYETTVDELFDADEVDPRIDTPTHRVGNRTYRHLSNRTAGMRVMHMTIKPAKEDQTLKTHDGYEWLYVIDGRLHLKLGEHDVFMGPGEVAEFDTRAPHWLGCAGDKPVEMLGIFSNEGERMHVTVKPKARE